jgi:hypothetical protein
MILGSLVLSDDLILSGLESAPPVAWSARRTLGKRQVVQSMPLAGGRLLSLQGDKHFSLKDLQDVLALAKLNQPVIMTHARGTFTILITAIDPEPAYLLADPDPEAYYSATITLQEV